MAGSSPAMTAGAGEKKKPRLSAGLSLLSLTSELAVLIGVHGFSALTAARILLLLAGLLATALLLLAGLLPRVLVLLARALVWVAHIRISLVERSRYQREPIRLVAREHRFRRDHCAAKPW